jgi:two-component system, LytTR family, response regulator
MAEIQVVLADDDELALSHLQRLLGSFPQVEVVGLARDGREAVSLIDRVQPDLIFIDVEMPGLNGFQVLKAITHKPIAVIITAHASYRQMAFETDAIECLLKPVDMEQMQHTMSKIEVLVKATDRINRSRHGVGR